MIRRILHVVESLDRGGLERVVCDLVLEQKRAGLDVEVFCLFRTGILAGELDALGVQVHEGHKQLGLDLKAARRLRKVVDRCRPDVVHTHNMVANYYAALAVLLPPCRVPIVNTCHNMGSIKRPDPRERWFRLSLLRTRSVAHVCEGAARKFVEAGTVPRRMARVVHNAIPLSRYATADPAARREARIELGYRDEEVVVGCVGRLEPVKNHSALIAAVASLRDSFPSLRLALVGDGALGKVLRGEAERLGVDRVVRLVGERADVPRLLCGFDVFALPSLSEGHSIALLEAAAVGLPIVATDVGGNSEIITDGVTGLLCRPDSQSLATTLRRLLQDAAEARRLGSAARSWAIANVSAESMSTAYRALYAEGGT